MKLKKVFIATPTAGGIVTTAYAATLIAITIGLRKRDVNYSYKNFDGSDIAMARNYLANTFLQDATSSHILFVDSDMAVAQETLAIMFDSNKEFIGTIYPERKLDVEKYGAYLLQGYTHQAALASALKYNVRHFSKTVSIENGLCRVKGLGFGCVLIAKSVFEKLVANHGVSNVRSALLRKVGYTSDAYDFFGEMVLENNGHLSEDYSFCERVNQSKVCDIWAVVEKPVGHVGQFTFGAPYIDKLMARQQSDAAVAMPKIAKQ